MKKDLRSCIAAGLVCGGLVFGASDTALAATSNVDSVAAVMDIGAADTQDASWWTRLRDDIFDHHHHRPAPPPPPPPRRPPPPPPRRMPPPPPPRRQPPPPPPHHRPAPPPPRHRAVVDEAPQFEIVMSNGTTNAGQY